MINTLAMIVAGIVIHLFRNAWGDISLGLLSLPWIISGNVFIPLAYRLGVKDGQGKQEAEQGDPPYGAQGAAGDR